MRSCSYSAYKKEAEIRSCVATHTCRGKKRSYKCVVLAFRKESKTGSLFSIIQHETT